MKSILKSIIITGLFAFSQQIVFSQDADKTVTLIVTGQGKTIDEAKTNALRSAIEQAFGTFISSNTTILNDSLIKDEVVSVTNGNIQKYNIVSETILPNGSAVATLKAIVSLTRLATFVESKGFEVSFNGEMFGMNIKLKKLNDEAEKKAVINLCTVSYDFLKKSLDYSLKIKEPTFHNTDKYLVEFQVDEKTNSNYNQFVDYFENTLTKIGLTKTELDDYESSKFPVYTIVLPAFNDRSLTPSNCLVISLRSLDSYTALVNLFIKSNDIVYDFEIFNNNKLLISKSYDWWENHHFPVSHTMINGVKFADQVGYAGKGKYVAKTSLHDYFGSLRREHKEFQSDNYFIGSIEKLEQLSGIDVYGGLKRSDGLIISLKDPPKFSLIQKIIYSIDEITKFKHFEIRPIVK